MWSVVVTCKCGRKKWVAGWNSKFCINYRRKRLKMMESKPQTLSTIVESRYEKRVIESWNWEVWTVNRDVGFISQASFISLLASLLLQLPRYFDGIPMNRESNLRAISWTLATICRLFFMATGTYADGSAACQWSVNVWFSFSWFFFAGAVDIFFPLLALSIGLTIQDSMAWCPRVWWRHVYI